MKHQHSLINQRQSYKARKYKTSALTRAGYLGEVKPHVDLVVVLKDTVCILSLFVYLCWQMGIVGPSKMTLTDFEGLGLGHVAEAGKGCLH